MGKMGLLRSLWVVSARPHPWAYLRDRLGSELIWVGWARPHATDSLPPPWGVAGAGSWWPPGLQQLRGRLAPCFWIGPAPADLPIAVEQHRGWQSVASLLGRVPTAEVAGVRLAPGCGLALPGGSYVSSAPELEALLAVHPLGLAGTAAAGRRVAAQLRRLGVPLRVANRGGRVRLEAASDGLAP